MAVIGQVPLAGQSSDLVGMGCDTSSYVGLLHPALCSALQGGSNHHSVSLHSPPSSTGVFN